jgi:hypothetical protein
VRAKLAAAFEDCLSDVMDQLWGALQYAGSRHARVDRMRQVRRGALGLFRRGRAGRVARGGLGGDPGG